MKQDLSKDSLNSEAEFFVFPISFAQQRLWFLNQLFTNNSFYNIFTALRITGSLNVAALEKTFNEIVRRHEVLRTNFRMIEGQPMQVIAPTLTIDLPIIDLRHLPSTAQEDEIQRIVRREQSHSFDLSCEALLRVLLLQQSSENILLLNLHHIICDGWSIGILIGEIGTLYTAFANHKPSPFEELPIQYADYTHWQQKWLQGEIIEAQINYWKQHLDKLSVLNLPTDRTRPLKQTYQGKTQFIEIPKNLSKQLEKLSQSQGVTLFMTLLAAFKTLLCRYSQQEDIVVGSPIANRNRREVEQLIGFFVNTLVLRTNLGENPTFLELLSRVREVTLSAYAHQDLPFEKLVEQLHPERSLSHHPLFQVVFGLQNTPSQTLELAGLTLKQLEFENHSTKFDLEFQLWESSQGIKGQVVYSTDLFDDATITRMLGHFQTLLEGIVDNPQQHLCELPLVTANELQQLLVTWNNTQINYSKDLCIHQLFEAQVKQTPNAIALVFQTETLTYKELNDRANQLAHYLQKLGVKPDTLVGICLERSVAMIVGILGILKAGGAYLPLDPNYPSERLRWILEDTQASLLVTQLNLVSYFQGESYLEKYSSLQHLLCLDKDWQIINQESQENPTSRVTSYNLAYLIYTSGSTGTPKGVLVQHQGLGNLWQAQVHTFNLNNCSRVLQFASLSFDASIFEIIMALLTGARLYLATKESLLSGQTLIKLLRDNAITHITLPPSLLRILPEQELPALQTIISAGEACSPDIIKHWARKRQFCNAYGPTEATVCSTIAQISNENDLSIGRPIFNTQIYILDSYLKPVPIGIPGELYIAGDGLARGYLNQPQLTSQQFIPNPFSNKAGARLYKTGDLATFKPDGNIKYLGRIDQQVKIRGFRIELSEIEAILKQHLSVKNAVVIVRESVPGHKSLVAYVVLNEKQLSVVIGTDKPSLLRKFLKEKLPEYMIPSAFFVLDSLPLTPNGKVNSHALKICESYHKIQEKELIAPRTSTESLLATIWTKLLNLESIGIYDNFFDLGGDSLLAVRLMSQIQEKFAQELPLSILFLNPTIESLANNLDKPKDSLPWSPLVPIQSLGNQVPFFCIHPIFGTVFPYYELAHSLGIEQPFYGLQPLGIDGQYPLLTCIEDMAAYYIKSLRTVQPQGPYCIGGWSFGGLVAFEMAQQLIASGQEVSLLAIIDTSSPSNKPGFWQGYKFLFTTTVRYILPFLLDYLYLLMPFTNFISQKLKQQILRELTLRPMFPIFQANSKATIDYSPRPYQGKITLFKSSNQHRKSSLDSTLGWQQLSSEVNVHIVPGNHFTMLKKPNVTVLGKQLRQCLEADLKNS